MLLKMHKNVLSRFRDLAKGQSFSGLNILCNRSRVRGSGFKGLPAFGGAVGDQGSAAYAEATSCQEVREVSKG